MRLLLLALLLVASASHAEDRIFDSNVTTTGRAAASYSQIGGSPTPTATATSATATPTPTVSPTPSATTAPNTPTPSVAGNPTVTPTPRAVTTPIAVVKGAPVNTCFPRGIYVANTNTVLGDSAGGSTSEDAVLTTYPYDIEIRELACSFATEVNWGRPVSVEARIARPESCNPTSDGGTAACTWNSVAGGNKCTLRGTLSSAELWCNADNPAAEYSAGPTIVPRNWPWHILITRNGYAGNMTCSWLVCPLAVLK